MIKKNTQLTHYIATLTARLKENAIFSTVLIISFLLHLAALFGISFAVTSPPQNKANANIDITLVREQTPEPPEQADYLAQANNAGSGEADEKSPNPSPEKQQNIADSAEPAQPIKPSKESNEVAKVATSPIASQEPVTKEPSPTAPPPAPSISPPPITPVTAAKSERQIVATPDSPDIVTDTAVSPAQPAPITPPKSKPSAANLVANSLEIARLESKLNQLSADLAKRPRKLPINSVSAKKYEASAYLEGWRKKIERVGTINYPQEAKRQGISGKLMLSVDIHPDGSIGDIVVSQSSGYKLLDDAAVKIVNLAAPYAPIPPNVLGDDYDMLTIIRTWNFDTSGSLQAR